MKVYGVANLDGLTEAKVAAESVAEAAVALGLSVPQLRKLGWQALKGASATAAKKDPGKPLYRALGSTGAWTTDRHQALASAAKAAIRSKRL